MCVYLSVTTKSASCLIYMLKTKVLYNYCFRVFVVWLSLKTLRSNILASFADYHCFPCFLTSSRCTKERAMSSSQQLWIHNYDRTITWARRKKNTQQWHSAQWCINSDGNWTGRLKQTLRQVLSSPQPCHSLAPDLVPACIFSCGYYTDNEYAQE